MTCGFVSIRLRPLMYVKLTNKSVTYVSGTFVTLDTGLNTHPRRHSFQLRLPVRCPVTPHATAIQNILPFKSSIHNDISPFLFVIPGLTRNPVPSPDQSPGQALDSRIRACAS